MRARREKHLTLLTKQLRAMNTFPGAIVAIRKILTVGWEEDWMMTLPSTNIVETKLQEAILQQSQEHYNYVARGYLVKQWAEVQHLWEKATNSSNAKYHWSKEVHG